MKNTQVSWLFVSILLVLQACGSRPEATSVKKSPEVASQSTSQSSTNSEKARSGNTTQPVDVAELQAKQNALEAEKADLLAQKANLEGQGAAFAQNSAVPPAMFGDFMADAQALPVAVDQAKIDAIVQAAMDMDFDALQKAIEDLLADIEALAADLQAQIDDLAAQIAAAS